MSIPELTAKFDASWAAQTKRYQDLWAQHEALKAEHQKLKEEHAAVLKQLAEYESKQAAALRASSGGAGAGSRTQPEL